MRKIIIFSLTISLLLFIKINFCYAGISLPRAGEVKVELSSPPELGKIVTFTATFTPLYDGKDCVVKIFCNTGIEILSEGNKKYRYSLGGRRKETEFIYKKGNIKKNEAFSIVSEIKAVRPGVWNIGAGFEYSNAFDKPGFYTSGKGFLVVVKEDGAEIYRDWDEISKEATQIASFIKIIPTMEAQSKAAKYEEPEPSQEASYEERKAYKKRYREFHKIFRAYLPKGIDLGFDPTYQFKVEYETSVPENTPIIPSGKLTWQVIGNIGEIDENGLFTATRFGKGKIRVEHGKWLSDEIDIEVIPHPNPSPADKIVDVIVVPYDTEEEREWVDKVLKEYKGKSFKSIKETHMKFNPKGAFKAKYVKKDAWGKEIKRIGHELIIEEGQQKKFLLLPINAEGKLIEWERKGDYSISFSDYDCREIIRRITSEEKILDGITYDIITYMGEKEGSCEIETGGCVGYGCTTLSRYQLIVKPKDKK